MNATEKKLMKVLDKLLDRVLDDKSDHELDPQVDSLCKAAEAIGGLLGHLSAKK